MNVPSLMDAIINFFIPREIKFFRMLAAQSANIFQSSLILRELVHQYDRMSLEQRKELVASIDQLERKGDEIIHDIISTLNKTFITPIDREDIHQIATYMDDVIDYINLVAKRLLLYKVPHATQPMHDLVDIIVDSANHINLCMRKLAKFDNVKQHYIAIHALENKADIIHDEAVAGVFNGHHTGKKHQSDPITVMKHKDIYDFLEKVTDKCEAVANVVEGIAVKHG